MLHHIHKHRHGIKKTFLAYLLLVAISFGLFYFFKSEIAANASQENDLDKVAASYQGLLPDTNKQEKKETPISQEKNMPTKGSYQVQTLGLPSYLVKMVVDGDTFVIEGDKRIRLAGIKSPDKDEELGIESTDFLREMISGKEVFVDLDKLNPKDSLGRFRAIVYVGKKNVNIEMIRSGFAHVFEVEPSVISFDSWNTFENEAREMQRGLWNKKRDSEAVKSVVKDKAESGAEEKAEEPAPQNKEEKESTPSKNQIPQL